MKTIHTSSPPPLPPIPTPTSPNLRALRRASTTPSASPRSPRYAPAKPPRPPSPRQASAARSECTPNAVLRQRSPDPVQRRVAQLLDSYLERALGPLDEDEEVKIEHVNDCGLAQSEPSETNKSLSQPSQSEPSASVTSTDTPSEEESAFRLFEDSQPGQLVLRKRPATNLDPAASPRNVAVDAVVSPVKRRKIGEEKIQSKQLATKENVRSTPMPNTKIRVRHWEGGEIDGSPCKKSRTDNGDGACVKGADAQRDSDDSDDDAEEMARIRSVVVTVAPPVVGSGE